MKIHWNIICFCLVSHPAFGQDVRLVQAEGFTAKAAMEAKLGGIRLVDFEDADTSQEKTVAIAADRYRAKGIVIKGQDGQFVGNHFGYPSNYRPVSGVNMFAPGPKAEKSAGKNDGGHETIVTFVDAGGRPAAVAGFGCYFIDCNYPSYGPSSIEAFDRQGNSLRVEKGFSGNTGSQLFRGIVISDEKGNPVPAIAKVKLINGSCWPEVAAGEGVVLDDFIFAPPQDAVAVARGGQQDMKPASDAGSHSPLSGFSTESKSWRWINGESRGDRFHLKMPNWARGGIARAVLSPDGNILATVTSMGEHAVWNLATGEARTLPIGAFGSNQTYRYLAISTDGKLLLTLSEKGLVAWDLTTLKPLTLLKDADPLCVPSWEQKQSADAQVIVTADYYPRKGGNGDLAVRRLLTGEKLVVTENAGFGWDAVLSADGKTFAASEKNGIRLFDVAGKKQRPGITGFVPKHRSVMLTSDGSMLIAGDSRDNSLTIWDIRNPAAMPRLIKRLPAPAATHTALSPDGKTLALSLGQNYVLMDVATGRTRGRITGNYALTFAPDGKTVLVGKSIADVATGQVTTVVNDLGDSPVFSQNGQTLAWIGSDGSATVLRLKADSTAGLLTARGNFVLPKETNFGLQFVPHDLTWSADGALLALGTPAALAVVDVRAGKTLFQEAPTASERGWGFLANRSFRIDLDDIVQSKTLIDLTTGKRSTQNLGRSMPGTALYRTALSPDGKRLAVCLQNDSASQTLLASATDASAAPRLLTKTPLQFLVFSPDSKRVALANGKVSLWDADSAQEIPTTADHAHKGMSFCLNGKALACWDDHRLHVYDLESGQELQQQPLSQGHQGNCLGAAVHPTAHYFVTAGANHDLLLKDLATGRTLQRLTIPGGSSRALCFSPDGKLLVAAVNINNKLSIYTWDMKP